VNRKGTIGAACMAVLVSPLRPRTTTQEAGAMASWDLMPTCPVLTMNAAMKNPLKPRSGANQFMFGGGGVWRWSAM